MNSFFRLNSSSICFSLLLNIASLIDTHSWYIHSVRCSSLPFPSPFPKQLASFSILTMCLGIEKPFATISALGRKKRKGKTRVCCFLLSFCSQLEHLEALFEKIQKQIAWRAPECQQVSERAITLWLGFSLYRSLVATRGQHTALLFFVYKITSCLSL